MYVFGSARRGRRARREVDEVRRALGLLAEERQAEIDQLRTEREQSLVGAQQEQSRNTHRLRRRAREAIDESGAVITERLQAVVEQVGAAREAATATHGRVTETSEAAAVLVRRARSADEAATKLNASLRQVAGVAGTIGEIASQTRMLALNATIEAARAGAAGKGFAVVADEVKSLAGTTAESTEQIAATIAALEADVAQMGGTLSAIVGGIDEIGGAMGQLGGIADDQHQIVERLNSTVDATMERIQDLSEVADRLERRRNERMAAAGPLVVRVAGRSPVNGQLTDLSSDGLGCLLPRDATVSVGDRATVEVLLSGSTFEVTGDVVRRADRPDGRELGLRLTSVAAPAQQQIEAYVTAALAGS
ncbi:methyl-accepting chemotaxis protein [Actinoplanes sp. TRM 88003]|uniref:Methyl-accepting chemotaxis protein n=1 Tax=Paractinoplanes aksuensis TaxID=2939490 RepID=A0ABT1DEU1_9ACTN|nr:methyl-accepting chemotaxis protein [Actinoplanes aksuensis]MCO8269330.1 methyl-accepting chemotaxis protein [Actinoplanes aksuensis]